MVDTAAREIVKPESLKGRLLETMKVNDPNALGPGQGIGGTQSAAVSKAGAAARTAPAKGTAVAEAGDAGDGVQLSDLVRNLRTLAADSPEREAYIESIARSYARGGYKVDAEATAGGIIDDALKQG
jgi:flagellar biosynthesis anti-sigma factor FlgM